MYISLSVVRMENITNAQAQIHFGTEFSWVCSALTVVRGQLFILKLKFCSTMRFSSGVNFKHASNLKQNQSTNVNHICDNQQASPPSETYHNNNIFIIISLFYVSSSVLLYIILFLAYTNVFLSSSSSLPFCRLQQ